MANFWRVISLLTGVMMMLGMGITYAFGSYSVELKTQLNYTETDINTVSSMGSFISFAFSIPLGFFYDKLGPRPTTGMGAILLFGGFFLMREALLNHVSRSPILFGLYYSIATLGTSCCVFSAIVTNTKNWATKHRVLKMDQISGLVFAGYGISAALISTLYDLFFKHGDGANLVGFFLTIAVVLSCLAVNAAVFMHPVSPPEEYEAKPLLSPPTDSPYEMADTGRVGLYGVVGGLRLLKLPQFACIFFSFSFTVGVGYLFITTVGSAHKAWKVTEVTAPTLVIILSFANLAGRLIMGGAIDIIQKRMPVAVAIIVPHFIIMLSFIALAFFDHFVTLLICTLTIAISYGASWPAYNVLLNYYFGDKHHGSNIGAITASGVSTAALGIIAGKLYDSHVPPNDPDHQCYGVKCYQDAYLIAASLMLLNLMISIVLIVTESRKRRLASVVVND